MPHRGEVGGHDIGHVGKVAGLLTVAEDGRPPALRHPLDEQRDHAAIRARRILPWSEDVEVTQAHAVEPHRLGVDPHVMLAGQFSGGVGAQRLGQHLLVFRQFDRVTVGAARRREHESAHARQPGRLEHVDRGGRAAFVRASGAPGRNVARWGSPPGGRRSPRPPRPGGRPRNPRRSPRSIRIDPRGEPGCDRRPVARLSTHADPESLAQQRLDQMRTDEPGSAGHQYKFAICSLTDLLVMPLRDGSAGQSSRSGATTFFVALRVSTISGACWAIQFQS